MQGAGQMDLSTKTPKCGTAQTSFALGLFIHSSKQLPAERGTKWDLNCSPSLELYSLSWLLIEAPGVCHARLWLAPLSSLSLCRIFLHFTSCLQALALAMARSWLLVPVCVSTSGFYQFTSVSPSFTCCETSQQGTSIL